MRKHGCELQVSSEDVVKAFIQRIKEVNSVLNCVVEDNFSSAVSIAKAIDEDIRNGRAQLDKPFLGVPFTVHLVSCVYYHFCFIHLWFCSIR